MGGEGDGGRVRVMVGGGTCEGDGGRWECEGDGGRWECDCEVRG